MQEPSAIVLCNDSIAIPALQALAFNNQLASICIPERNKEALADLKEIFADIPLIQLKKAEWKKQVSQAFDETGAALGFLMTFPWKLEKNLIDKPARGFYNFHYGMLPQYRGNDPVFFQIKNREGFAGISVHKVEGTMDTGPIVMQEKIQLNKGDTYGLLKSKLGQRAGAMLMNFLKILSISDRVPCLPQDESKAKWYDKPGINDVMIDWQNMNGEEVIALINACNPWNKGAGTVINGLGIRILEAGIATVDSSKNLRPGQINFLNSGVPEVTCSDGSALALNIIYTSAGFTSGSKLKELGIRQGDIFA